MNDGKSKRVRSPQANENSAMQRRWLPGKGLLGLPGLVMSRRLALALALLLVVVACAGNETSETTVGDSEQSTSSTSAPAATTDTEGDSSTETTSGDSESDTDARRGGILTTAGSDLDDLDPHTATTQDVPTRMAYESLVSISPSGEVVPELAAEWSILNSGLTYEFVLQPDAQFHDIPPVNGRAVTADDVAYSLNRVATGEGFPHTDLTEPIAEYEVVDEQTIRLHLEEAFAPLLYSLASHWTAIMPQELAEDHEVATTTVIGTGPFMLESSETDVVYNMVRNPDYWKDGLPYLDGIEYLVMTDAQSQVAAFRAGQLDIFLASPTQAGDIERTNPDAKIQSAGSTQFHLLLNVTEPPFDDPRVRRAVHLAIDRQAAIELGADGRGRLMGILSESYRPFSLPTEELAALPGYRQPKTEDLDEARDLLEEAGYADGLSVACIGFERSIYNHVTQLEVIQPMLAEVGVEMEIQPVDVSEWRERLAEGDFECNLRSTSVRQDADSHVSERFWSESASNHAGFVDEKVDELIDAERRAVDQSERVELFHELELYLQEAPPEIPIYQRFSYRVMQPYVEGYEIGLFPSYSEEFGATWFDK